MIPDSCVHGPMPATPGPSVRRQRVVHVPDVVDGHVAECRPRQGREERRGRAGAPLRRVHGCGHAPRRRPRVPLPGGGRRARGGFILFRVGARARRHMPPAGLRRPSSEGCVDAQYRTCRRDDIVAMVGGEVVKVECRACGSVHKYRPQKKDAPRRAAPSVRKVRAGSTRAEAVDVSSSRSEAARKAAATRAQQRAARDAEATEVAWKVAMTRNAAAANRTYSMNESGVRPRRGARRGAPRQGRGALSGRPEGIALRLLGAVSNLSFRPLASSNFACHVGRIR